jgi:hypothetical protein
MFDRNFHEIKKGDFILFACGQWSYRAKVWNVNERTINHIQIDEGNGYGIDREHNKIECSRYITIIRRSEY